MEENLLPNFNSLRKSFGRFQAAIIQDTAAPNLTQTPDEKLLVGLVYLRWLRLEYVTRIMDRIFPGLSWIEAYRRSLSLIDSANPAVCAWLYISDRNLNSLAHYLRKVALELSIFEEIERRAKTNKLGREIYVYLSSGLFNPQAVLKALKMERLTSYRESKESAEDLQQIAFEKAWCYFKEMGKERTADIIGPKMKLKPNRWESLLPSLQVEELKALLRDVWSTLPSQAKKLSRQTRQALRDHWEKWEAQKRTGDEVIFKEAGKEIASESLGQWLEKRQQGEESSAPDISAKMFKVLREAKGHKRWGDRAVKAFLFYLEDKPEAEAAKLAGITDRTFRNYIARLREIFSSKK